MLYLLVFLLLALVFASAATGTCSEASTKTPTANTNTVNTVPVRDGATAFSLVSHSLLCCETSRELQHVSPYGT